MAKESATLEVSKERSKTTSKEIKGLYQEGESILDAIKRDAEIIDAEFNIRYVSKRCQETYGDPKGKKCYEYLMGRSKVCPNCGIVEAMKIKAPFVTEKTLPKENNRVVQVTTIPFQEDKGDWLFAEVVVDKSDRKEAEEALRESEERMRTILNALPDLIVQVNPDMRIVWANKRALDLNPDAIGQTCFKAYVYKDESCEGCPCKRALKTGQIEIGTMYQPAVGGFKEESYWEDIGVPLKDHHGHVTSVIEIARNVTRRKQAEERLNRYISELKVRNEELDAFSYTVAHDLKNLIGVLLNCGYILEQGSSGMSSEKLLRNANRIIQNSRKMINIIDALMLLANVRKQEKVEVHPLYMKRIINEAKGRLADLIQEHQAKIVIQQKMPVALGYDPWIEEVWVNYLSNAIKYGGRPPLVKIGATKQENGMIRFWVRDNGGGFSPEEKPQLFVPFTQIRQARLQGQGLGLSIVRRIVEKLGGEVGLESEVGQGSMFFFTLQASRKDQ